MTKSQRIAQRTNEINKYARIVGLPYSKFLKISSIVTRQWPHSTMQDLAEDIDCLFNDPDLVSIKNYTPEEIASFVLDLWETIYV
jgi:hypothetical protein